MTDLRKSAADQAENAVAKANKAQVQRVAHATAALEICQPSAPAPAGTAA